MDVNMDCIKFETRHEIDEVCGVLHEWLQEHPNDDKRQAAERLKGLLDFMYMSW